MRISQCVDFIFAAAGNISRLHNDDVRQHRISTFYKMFSPLNASTRLRKLRRGKQREAATMITLRVNLGPFFEEFDIKKIADCEWDPRTPTSKFHGTGDDACTALDAVGMVVRIV